MASLELSVSDKKTDNKTWKRAVCSPSSTGVKCVLTHSWPLHTHAGDLNLGCEASTLSIDPSASPLTLLHYDSGKQELICMLLFTDISKEIVCETRGRNPALVLVIKDYLSIPSALWRVS